MSRPKIDEKLRVLVVEDDASVRRSMQMLLQGNGFDVRAYTTVDQILQDDSIDEAACLVADYRLDGSDGIAVLDTLRQRGWHGPAILMTAFPTDELRRSAQAAGFDAFLEKPFRDHALVNSVTRLTREYQSR